MELSDEDKRILNEEMFFYVRSYIRRKKSSAEIIGKIGELLKEGADINACDPSDNTIVQIAAQHNEKDVVIYLLQNGAILISNKNEQVTQGNSKSDAAIQEIKPKQSNSATSSATKVSNKEQSAIKIKPQINRNLSVETVKSDQDVSSYQKRAGTSGVSGQFYETKLLSLIFHRALHDKDINQFYLASNIKDIGDFDDVCFRFGDVACFMQTKHRENTDNARLTVASVRSTTSKLGLGIYFDSFLKTRQSFSPNSSCPMFKGKFEDIDSYFVLYTPLKESFERKLSGNKQICNKLHDMISTGENNKNKCTDIFQFDYEDQDLDFLTKFIKNEHMKVLAKTFLEFILSNNKLGVMMTSDLIKIYHPALVQKVISIWKVLEPLKATNTPSNMPNFIHKGKFRSEFFRSEDPDLIALKETFYKEIVFTHSLKTKLTKEEVKQKIKEISDYPCAETISKLIGSPIKFDDTIDKLSLDVNKLPKNKYKQNEIQQIRFDLQKIPVTRTMVRNAVHLAAQKKLEILTFQLPQSFGNVDLTTNQKTVEGLYERLDFLANKFNLLIQYFAERNINKETKIIDISSEVVGPGKILELKHLSSNGGIGGAVGNLLLFDKQNELFRFNTEIHLAENGRYVLQKIKELSGEDLTNYAIKIIIDGFPRISFDTYQYDKNIAADFLSKLWFYTNQAQEESVEITIKKEINVHYNADNQRHQFLFHVHSDAIFLRFHDEIQKWWKKQTEAHYLTKNSSLYDKAKKGIVDSPLLTVLNVMLIRMIKNLNIEFNINAINCLNLDKYPDKNQNWALNIVSDAVMLSAAKIMQYWKYHNKCTFINLDYVHILPQNDYDTMMEELKIIKNMTLVITSETSFNQNLLVTLLNILNIITKQQLLAKIIIISGEPLQINQAEIFENYEYVTLRDENVNLLDLTSESQDSVLDKCSVIYQGQEIKLDTILDDNSKNYVSSKVLWSLLHKYKMEIGQMLETHKYNEIKNYYIRRNLKFNGEEYEVDTFDDIEDQIVLISSKPCMGKSILLTHLSLETKKVNPKLWIVKINMSDSDKQFLKINKDDMNTIMPFLCKGALKNSDDLENINFTVTNNTVTVECRNGKQVSFELQIFIHLFNTGSVIFLFDGFDKIYPQNTNEGIELFTALERADKRMWITSDCYVVKVLECKFRLTSYKLERISTLQQKGFLQRFWSTNIELEKLNHEQFNNITLFFNYILKYFNRKLDIREDVSDRPMMPMLSVPLHVIYLTLLEYFKNEVESLSPRFLRETIKKKWGLDRYTAFDRMLGRSNEETSLELAGTPLHMYLAGSYFVFQITDKFDLHIDTKAFVDRSGVYLDALTLYERFLKANVKKMCEIENRAAISIEQETLRDDFFNNHKKLAIYALCKERDVTKILPATDIQKVKKTIKMIQTGEIKTNLIDSVVDGVPRFYHLLFAEYFVVEALSELFRQSKNNNLDLSKLNSIWDFTVNIVLLASPRSLRNAFEYKLKYDPELAEIAGNDDCQKIIFDLLVKQNRTNDENTIDTDNALTVAINEGLVNTTNFLLKAVQHKVNENNIGNLITIVKSSANILGAVDTSRSILSENVLKCIQNIDGESIIQLLNCNNSAMAIEERIKTNLVTPVINFAESIIRLSGNNENLVKLAEELPYHIPFFIRQFSKKK